MPTTNQDIQKVEEQRKQASAKNREAADYGAASTTLGDNVWEAVRADRRERGVSQIATDVGNVMGQMASQPENIKSFAGDMVNPMDVDQFTGSARASQLRTLGTIATQQGENYGTLQEIIQAGANQLVARGQIKLADAERLTAEADALMERLEYEEQVRQFNEQLEETKRQFNQRDRGGSGGSGLSISGMSLPTEDQPAYTPASGEGSVSEGGQWVYTNGKWQEKELSREDLQKQLAGYVASGDLTSTDAKFILDAYGGKELDTATAQSISSRLGELSNMVGTITPSKLLLEKVPFARNSNLVTNEQQKILDAQTGIKLIGMEIARMFEQGRLSDEDRNFYLSQLPSDAEIAESPQRAMRKINAMKSHFDNKVSNDSGGSSGNSNDPLGLGL